MGKALDYLTGPSNTSVTINSSVANCVAVILLCLSTAGCNAFTGLGPSYSKTQSTSATQAGQTSDQASSETEAERAERQKHPFVLAPERMSVEAPASDVQLGNPFELKLTFAPGKQVGPVLVSQRSIDEAPTEAAAPAKVISTDGDHETIQITPTQIGLIEVGLATMYADNALVAQTVRINVVASKKGLKAFSLNQGMHSLGMRINNDRNEHGTWLQPVVSYNDLPNVIYLHNSEQLKLSVEQDPDDPVISVSDKGLVHAIRRGKAIITGDFDGVKDQVTVVVR